MEEEVVKRESLVQKIVASVFQKAGFQISTSSNKFGFKTDIIATKASPEMTVVVTCKEHGKYPLNMESLIHEWDSKRRVAGAQAALVVISGMSVDRKFFDYAKNVGVGLWDEGILYNLITGQGRFDDLMRVFIQFDTTDARGGVRPKKVSLAVKVFKRILIAAIIYTISLAAALVVYYLMNLQLLIMWLVSCVAFIILIVLKGYFLPEI